MSRSRPRPGLLRAMAAACALWLAGSVVAQRAEAAAPLRLEEVLETLPATHPELEAADARVDAAKARHFAAKGFFDPRLGFSTRWTPLGYEAYYPQTETDLVVQQATPLWGTRVYAGHRLGLGNYQVYKGGLETLSGGELRAGVAVPILRDGRIDEGRARIQATRALAEGAEKARDLRQLEAERLAARAYWEWFAAGMRLHVARTLHDTAARRADQLQTQADAGALARIVVLDNDRLVLERKARVVGAEQAFRDSALALSLHYRDERLEPIVVGEERLPAAFPAMPRPTMDQLEAEIARALEERPDLQELEAHLRAADVTLRLAKNRRLPSLDLHGFVSKDFGEGPEELRPAEAGIGVMFGVALPMRAARGEVRAAQADIRGIEAHRRALRDGVSAQIRQAYVAWDAAYQQAELAREQREVAQTLADAEMDRFRAGASDLVVVNLRELAAADAAVQEIDARAEVYRAQADFLLVTGRGF